MKNVKAVQLINTKPFRDTVDHSKWCVTPDGSSTCIADMNREESQKERGGGAICTSDGVVGNAFYTLIKEYEPCEHQQVNAEHREL